MNISTKQEEDNKIEVTTKEKVMSVSKKILLYTVLLSGVAITLFPFFYMLVLATKTRAEIFNYPPPLWFGDAFFANLNTLLSKMPFYTNVFNSVFVAVTTTALTLFFCSLGGYGFAKYDFKGKDKLFFAMIGTMMVPMLLGVIPWFIMMREFGWINTFWPLIIPGIANPFGIFLMKQFMDNIPDSLIDAARIDGCGEFEIFYKIALPLSLPGLGTLGILTFLASWNRYMQPLLILQEKSMYTIPVALSKLQGKIDQNWGAQMVGTALAIAPIVIAFVLASKQFISGITAGATKG
ncbi:ABC-type sugar transport system, permease component [Halobacteroides halobius DSM 5150]|uniref:ABC-type sugar transport system, permease component n=1 Tax=Halobacteroides halobius (strain ATCC 35273 / DSM 5150 / MD-1) TaxID=748449 RepID=L0K828_HALHC|nr:carbohydrate ABC transporter permease [Halobacteroides halobius]AGB40268.1 ABC-type sugar transport system, permease component [Halobacteroides halobius DSM 5150]